jgi:soluble lytic murein transglycosylase-like protein
MRFVIKYLFLWLCPWAAVAHADVYVAYDEQGVAHFAGRALDGRYQLLFQDVQAALAAERAAARPAQRLRQPAPELRAELERAAQRHGLDYALLHALVQVESGFDAAAVSPKGAVGLMQLMPATARRYGVSATDAGALKHKLQRSAINVDAGSRYLRDLLSRYDGRTELALAAYNAGEGAVQRAGEQIPDYRETRNYVLKVLALREQLRATARTPLAAGGEQPPAAVEPQRQTVQVFQGEAVQIMRFEQGFSSPP